MGFAERLLEDGFRSRYQILQVPFRFRDEDGGGDDGGDNDDGDNDSGDDGESQGGDGLTLHGLATPFDSPTRIRTFFDEFDEQFEKGAFKRTIGQEHQVMLFEHGDHPLLGSMPIADIRQLREIKEGLEVQARMFDNWMTQPLQDAIRARAIPGMSIMFRSVKELIEERDDDVPLVTVQEAELRELGPVLFPAYRDTHVELRGVDESVRQHLEQALRVVGGRPAGGASKTEPPGPGSTHPVSTARRNRAERLVRLHEVTT